MDKEVKYQIQWLIAEYQELRKEINRRSKEQFVCITASIVALGTLVGILSQNLSKFYPLLILISWILTVFGFIWTDHSKQIFLIGSYIRETIESRINQFTNFDSKNAIGWEHQIQKIRKELKEQGEKPAPIISSLPFIYFIIPSFVIILTYIILRLFPQVKLEYELPILIEVSLIFIGFFFIYGLLSSWKKALDVITR